MTISAASFPGWKAGTWVLDPAHTEIEAVVRHLAISKVRGIFEKFEGTVTLGDTLESSKVVATVEVGSINTRNEQRDHHLHTSDFFAVDEYPTATFTSTVVRVDGDDILVDGDLTLRGVTKPVTFEVEFGGFTVDGYGNSKVGFEAEATINRKDFGVNWNAPTEAGGLTLGDEVKLEIEGQGIYQK